MTSRDDVVRAASVDARASTTDDDVDVDDERAVEGEPARARTSRFARARAARRAIGARVRDVVAFARAFAREQWPPDAAWVAEVERVRELAAYEAYARDGRGATDARGCATEPSAVDVDASASAVRAVRASASTLERRVDDVCAAVEALRLESPASSRRGDAIEAEDAVDGDEIERARTPSTPSRDAGDGERMSVTSPSFEGRDVVFEDSPEPEHRVLVVPRALARDGAALRTVRSNAVSFVAPRENESNSRRLTGKVTDRASAYWSGRAESTKPLVVRATPISPPSPPSPECPIPILSPSAKKTTAHPRTPPWYLKRIDRETRELQKSARTLIDWTSDALRDICPILDDATTHTHQIPHISLFDGSECDAVALLTPVDDVRVKRE